MFTFVELFFLGVKGSLVQVVHVLYGGAEHAQVVHRLDKFADDADRSSPILKRMFFSFFLDALPEDCRCWDDMLSRC